MCLIGATKRENVVYEEDFPARSLSHFVVRFYCRAGIGWQHRLSSSSRIEVVGLSVSGRYCPVRGMFIRANQGNEVPSNIHCTWNYADPTACANRKTIRLDRDESGSAND